MATSDAKRRADMRWKLKNMHNFTVQMRNAEADALRAATAAAGTTPHAVFLAAAREYLRQAAANTDAGPGERSGVESVDAVAEDAGRT